MIKNEYVKKYPINVRKDEIIDSFDKSKKYFRSDWMSLRLDFLNPFLDEYIGKDNLRILEVGVFEGRFTHYMSKYILTGNNNVYDIIDVFSLDYVSIEHAEVGLYDKQLYETFNHNINEFKSKITFNIMVGSSDKILPDLKNMYDFIFVDAAHNAADVYKDLIHSHRMLKNGGKLLIDDYVWALPHYPDLVYLTPRIGINEFIKIHKKEYKLIKVYSQIQLKKISNSKNISSVALSKYDELLNKQNVNMHTLENRKLQFDKYKKIFNNPNPIASIYSSYLKGTGNNKVLMIDYINNLMFKISNTYKCEVVITNIFKRKKGDIYFDEFIDKNRNEINNNYNIIRSSFSDSFSEIKSNKFDVVIINPVGSFDGFSYNVYNKLSKIDTLLNVGGILLINDYTATYIFEPDLLYLCPYFGIKKFITNYDYTIEFMNEELLCVTKNKDQSYINDVSLREKQEKNIIINDKRKKILKQL